METTTIVIIVAIIALIAFYLYNRNKPAPRGTYDDKDLRSNGSIGGGTRAHDDANVRSSGSIGGGTRAYDSPDQSSGGSIGGRQRSENHRTHSAANQTAQPQTVIPEPQSHPNERERTLPPLNHGTALRSDQPSADQRDTLQEDEQLASEKEHNDKFKSGGSFGASRS